MKRGDLARVRIGTKRFIGKIALVVGRPKRAGETEYVQVICDGIRMMPLHWLEPVE